MNVIKIDIEKEKTPAKRDRHTVSHKNGATEPDRAITRARTCVKEREIDR